MALFGRNADNPSSPDASPQPEQITLVGEGSVFEGTLQADGDVRASGRVTGIVDVEGTVVVAESGAVDGELRATNASIAGQMRGDIIVEERLTIRSTAEVDGSIQAGRLVIEEGAVFTGECDMGRVLPQPDRASDGVPAHDDSEVELRATSTEGTSRNGQDRDVEAPASETAPGDA